MILRKPLTNPLYLLKIGNPIVIIGVFLLLIMVFLALISPFVTQDPHVINPLKRLKAPSEIAWFGTDQFGRDLFARTLQGARVSLMVGLTVALLSAVCGMIIGILCGFYNSVDRIVMRIMDGIMAIPTMLLAIALTTLLRGGVFIVIIAITLPEIPRVVRLVRSLVLSIKTQAYVKAAISGGTRELVIMCRHVLPNTLAPLIVQITFVCGSAILTEAALGFLGAGIPPETPSWGNIIASGRSYFQLAPWVIFFPGISLAVTILAVNLLGDALRDRLGQRDN